MTTNVSPIRYTLDRSETLHTLVARNVEIPEAEDLTKVLEGEYTHRTGGNSRSSGDPTGHRKPDYESETGENATPEDTSYHIIAKINIPNGTIYLVTGTAYPDGNPETPCEPGHEDHCDRTDRRSATRRSPLSKRMNNVRNMFKNVCPLFKTKKNAYPPQKKCRKTRRA